MEKDAGKILLLSWHILYECYLISRRNLSFILCQNIIERFTRQQGWKFARLDGNTNIASRQKLVDRFNQDESYFVMLMTTRTGGVGLNVTGANRVLLYDPDWNPQTE
jgi:superfamily II DNA or RNA helicase